MNTDENLPEGHCLFQGRVTDMLEVPPHFDSMPLYDNRAGVPTGETIGSMKAKERSRRDSAVSGMTIEGRLQAAETCRDHWKTSFEHERENVIRLRQIVYKFHADSCVCEDCELVRQHEDKKPS